LLIGFTERDRVVSSSGREALSCKLKSGGIFVSQEKAQRWEGKDPHADPEAGGLAQKMVGHFIPYEVGMMRALYNRLLAAACPTQLDRNAHIESFHIHARNLIEFFTDDKQCAIDPRAFTTNDYRVDGLFISKVSKKLESKISQQIVHLTHERTDVASDKLSDDERRLTILAIETEIKRFCKELRPEWRQIWDDGLKLMDFEGEGAPLSGSVGPGGPTGPASPGGPTNHVTSVSSDHSRIPGLLGPSGSTGSMGPALNRSDPDEERCPS
jgi:hypothetical protein